MEQQGKNENFNGKWRDIAPVGLVLLVAFVALVAFHRWSGLGKLLSNDYYAMVGTTLLAAVLGFGAIWHQTRSSYRQLREQLAAQRDAEREERERQKRAVATALLFEIDCFRTIELDFVEESLARRHRASNGFPTGAGLRTNLSEIYRGVSPLLGSLNSKSVSAIVRFYSMVGMYEALWREYQYCLDMLRSPVNPSVNIDPQRLANEAERQVECIRSFIPKLKTLAGNVINLIAHDCSLEELIERSNAQTH